MSNKKQTMGAFARPLGGLQKENMSKFGNKYFTYDFKAFFESKENYIKPGNKLILPCKKQGLCYQVPVPS